MLKIKDDVDLKELEKFGFKKGKELIDICPTYLEEGTEYMFNWYLKFARIGEDEWGYKIPFIAIMIRDKGEILIDIHNNDYTYHTEGCELKEIENTLYDLIQAGLVEKVEE